MSKTLSPWRQTLRQNIHDLKELSDLLELSEDQKSYLYQNKRFILNVPRRLALKMEKGNINDPLFKQFVSVQEETLKKTGFCSDPVADDSFRKEKKLLHKYEGRALLVTTSACAMHCRYCFRQNFSYDTEKTLYTKEIERIKEDVTLEEIILSGGDPLSLDNEVLKYLLDALEGIPHIKRIRFHSRFVIGIPERVDEEFLKLLENLKKQIYFVVHINHPKELDEDVFFALKQIQQTGAVLLNQSVLLKDINDTLAIQKKLSCLLVDNGILPYYLHQLDKVEGATHFEVEEDLGKELIENLSNEMSGYAVPKYVREIAGAPKKTPIV